MRAGVTRLVLLSGRGEPEAQDAERALQRSGADWTILRCSWFNQNFSESFLIEPIRAGVVALPVGFTPEPFVDTDDVADAAVAALTQAGHSQQLYELTGPRAISFPEALDRIATATRRDIRLLRVPAADYRAELARQQVPDCRGRSGAVPVDHRARRPQPAHHRWRAARARPRAARLRRLRASHRGQRCLERVTMGRAMFAGVCAALLGSAIVGGMFYAFSSFVMKALARVAPEHGVPAMNAINVVVINPSFMLVFAGTALLSAVLAVAAVLSWSAPGSALVLVGALLYAFGTFGVTMARNQPMNLRLGALPLEQALGYWPLYVSDWLRWNHLRTAASLLATAAFMAALRIAQ